ncbi:hypothetical protein TNCV_1828941 [Trichonephila clavipes]|nr:hypothetical protein TNCV_1828941 [Trichonephila clavipes]
MVTPPSPPPQCRHGTEGKGDILRPLHSGFSLSLSAHNQTFGPPDLTSPYSVCTRRVFGGIEPRPSGLESDAITTRLPTAICTTACYGCSIAFVEFVPQIMYHEDLGISDCRRTFLKNWIKFDVKDLVWT